MGDEARVTAQKIPVSAIVMTKDEEANIGKCLESLVRFDQVFVVDSMSLDRTQEIARAAGAEVVEFVWSGGYPKKKQWSLDNLVFRHDWVLYVDADEELTVALADEIDRTVKSLHRERGFFIRLDYVFLGRELRHGLRVYKLALLDRRHGRFLERDDLDAGNMWEVEGHYQPSIDGPVGTLTGRIVHRDAADLYHYFDRHNRYSDWEAALRIRGGDHTAETQTARRSRLKRLFARMPLRPAAVFLYSYLFAGGFLDGRAGFHYAVSRSFYYWQIDLKTSELRNSKEFPSR